LGLCWLAPRPQFLVCQRAAASLHGNNATLTVVCLRRYWNAGSHEIRATLWSFGVWCNVGCAFTALAAVNAL
jgi:hypothetical protein